LIIVINSNVVLGVKRQTLKTRLKRNRGNVEFVVQGVTGRYS